MSAAAEVTSPIREGGVGRAELETFLRQRLPHHRLVEVTPLGADVASAAAVAHKGEGYGVPVRLGLVDESTGRRRDLVLHFAAANRFGHERRADRADELLLAYDTFHTIPRQAAALDVGVVDTQGHLHSLREAGEFWLLTDWIPGHLYAEELRRIAASGVASPADVTRARTLARYLVDLHTPVDDDGVAYSRAVRDLVGHGEGVFGIVDGYPDDVPGASPARLEAIEARCVAWRWSLKGRRGRLTRTHGDFHPWNVLFGEDDALSVLDASRGGKGDPADDVTCLAINYVFFALGDRAGWERGFAPLWRAFWSTYLEDSGDPELLEVVAPFLAWRALVLCSPRWYPDLDAVSRSRLLGLVERVLDAPRFAPEWADELFR
jgi:aminoglycoside phosphotransferase (APT) family kinase protein